MTLLTPTLRLGGALGLLCSVVGCSRSSPNNDTSHKPVPLSGPNQVLLEYLGAPVDPPPKSDVRYTKEGVSNAIQLAAQNAGITLKRMAVDDSEYPCLVGIICEQEDYPKLTDEIKRLDGYDYNGSVGGTSCHTFSITPRRAYPRDTGERIGRRLMLRQQVFYDRFSAQ